MKGGEVSLVGRVDVSPGREQHGDRRLRIPCRGGARLLRDMGRAAEPGGHHERRGPVIGGEVGIGIRIQQCLYDLGGALVLTLSETLHAEGVAGVAVRSERGHA